MDFAEFFDNLKEKFSEIKDTVLEWIEENKKMTVIIASMVLLILICLLLIAVSVNSKKKKQVPAATEAFVINEPLLIPNGPELPRDYTLSRQTKEHWTDEEAEEWFTTPTEKEINALSQTNENMINEIIGAAP